MARDEHFLDYDGRFRLVRKVAQGGMARVYEAEQLGPSGFAKRIALKVIHPEYATEKAWLQLFIDEAKLSANLIHGNIVQIYQLGEIEGEFFIAMEYIQGPTLRSIIDRHREIGQAMPRPLAAYAASRVARALDFAHNAVGPDGRRLEIVHRDVSPGNVLVTWDGHIKLGDFGIAKARTSADPSRDGRMLMGKKHYMSPEQMLGLDVGPRSDVFSLGVVLYELLTDVKPFRGASLADITRAVLEHDPPRADSIDPQVPEGLALIAAKAMAKDPEQRYRSAGALARDLRGWLEGHARAAEAVAPPPRTRRRHWPWLAAASTATVAAVAAWYLTR